MPERVRTAAQQEECDNRIMGSPEQHRIPQPPQPPQLPQPPQPQQAALPPFMEHGRGDRNRTIFIPAPAPPLHIPVPAPPLHIPPPPAAPAQQQPATLNAIPEVILPAG